MTVTVELDTDIKVNEQIMDFVQEPGKYKVIFLNDDATPMDFVVEILVQV